MSFYSLSDEQVLKMPVGRFWLLEKNVARIQAESDIRNVNVVSVPHVKNGQEVQNRLIEELGTIVVMNHKRDDNASQRLMALGGR